MRGLGRLPVVILLIAAMSPDGLYCQSNRTQAGEIGVYTGTSFGGLGGHPAVGGYFGGAFSRYAIALIDACYLPIGNRTMERVTPGTLTSGSGLYDFNFTVHVRVPFDRKWAPYGIAGTALLYNRYIAESVSPDGSVNQSTHTNTKFGFETGAGVRYYLTNNVGIRGEFRQTVSTHNFSRLLVGVLYQFDEGTF